MGHYAVIPANHCKYPPDPIVQKFKRGTVVGLRKSWTSKYHKNRQAQRSGEIQFNPRLNVDFAIQLVRRSVENFTAMQIEVGLEKGFRDAETLALKRTKHEQNKLRLAR
jgi:hypothetical protein